MIDALYVLGTFLFFALMLLYVAACERLGRGAAGTEQTEENRS